MTFELVVESEKHFESNPHSIYQIVGPVLEVVLDPLTPPIGLETPCRPPQDSIALRESQAAEFPR